MRPPRHPLGFKDGSDPRPVAAPRQRSFDDVETPLYDVTFCAVDLETTGGSSKLDEIVEIGAVKSRGGTTLGTFETFVKPNADLPIEIQLLTGIRPSMLADAEPLPDVLPSFLEFCRGSVFVAHNARFDHSFINEACRLLDYEPFEILIVDTVKLARRILRGDTPNHRLHTLASFFRTSHTPSHRAFADAAACLEVLHGLLERASAYGITTLADLLEIQRPRSNPHFEKVRLARGLPRARGVYLFRNKRHEVIYVGKATDLRSRVRSYFTSDERKRIGDLRAEATSVDTIVCDTDVEASALEARLIERLAPRYNRRGVRRRKPVYLKLTSERHPRFSVVTKPSDEVCIGPFTSRKRAQAAATTLAGLFGVRTCTVRIGPRTSIEPCPLYELGTCHGPCTGRQTDTDAHANAVDALRADLARGLPEASLRLAAKLSGLAARHRFEEAAAHRDAFEALARTVERAGRLRAITEAGRIEFATPDGPVRLRAGCIQTPADRDADPPSDPASRHAVADLGLGERSAVASWLEGATDVRIVRTDRPLAYPWPRPAPPTRIEIAEQGRVRRRRTIASEAR